MVHRYSTAPMVCLVCLAATGSTSAVAVRQVRAEGPRVASAGQLIISEFRLRGPNGAFDEYIEIFNKSGASHTVSAASGTGYGIAASDGVTRCTIPNGTVIADHGHFLCVNAIGYSLASYPDGNGDAFFTININDNAGIALFNNNTGGGSYSVANRLDAVGSASEADATYKEGIGYPSLAALNIDYAFVRKVPGQCSVPNCGGAIGFDFPAYSSAMTDSDNNVNDFLFVETDFNGVGPSPLLGAPGPQNLSAPIALDGTSTVTVSKLSGCQTRDEAPNRVRDLTTGGPNASIGTLDLRTTWKNSTGANLTRLRFRIVDVTTFPAGPGTADLRPRTSASVAAMIDGFPCGGGSSVTVLGTTLEEPPSQPNGGGYNVSLRVDSVTPATQFVNGASINVRMLFGVEQTGHARICVIAETLPASAADPWCYINGTDSLTEPAIGDFDGDRTAEMPMYNGATGQWKILKSSSGFAAETLIAWGGPGYIAVPGDYDGDGHYDAAVYNPSTGIWSILTSSSNYTRAFNLSLGGPAFAPAPGDYDGDGVTDPSVTTSFVWDFRASSTNFALIVAAPSGGPGDTPVPGQDFDGDGATDMVLYHENSGVWSVRTSGSNFATSTTTSWGGTGYTLVPGDYDGDGKADYGLYHRATGTWSILQSIGGYTSTLSVSWGGPGFLPVPADFDDDGRFDIAVYQRATTKWMARKSTTSYTTVLQATYGTPSDDPISTAVLPRSSREIHAGTFDADATSDITVYNTSNGVWSTLNSRSAFTTATNRGWGGAGYTPVPGDYDGDARADLALYQPSTGQWLVLRSSSNFTTTYSFNAGGAGYDPVPADYDGDGRTDMVVYNTTTGLWYGLKSSSNFTTTLSVSWGGSGYTATPGDFDADGALDLALYQASTGNWFILKSSTGYTTSLMRSFGGSGYAPVAADFDGDGITDFAVYQTSTGVWTMLKSSSGNVLGFTVSYGGAGYTPVAGDWDGDGHADVGVYNAATGNWSILLSRGSYTTSLNRNWGGAGYMPVPQFP